jgi:hypothetical protein
MAAIQTILLTIHLLAMNVASAGPLVCIWLRRRGGRGDVEAWNSGKELARWTVAGLLAGAATGVALGAVAWFDPRQEFAETVHRFPTSDIVFFVGEVLFALVCLSVYARTWERWQNRPWLHPLFAILAATNLLYHFPPLMIVIGELAVRPETVVEPVITRAAYRPLMLRPDVLSQSLHIVLASLAAAGIALIAIARRQIGGSPGNIRRLMIAGAWIALTASLLQLADGVWVLFELPPDARGVLIGDAWPATGLFVAAIIITLGLLHALGALAFGDTRDATVRRCELMFVGVVLLMATMLRVVRSDESRSGGSAAARMTVEDR